MQLEGLLKRSLQPRPTGQTNRYVPNEDIRSILTARRETSEQEFIALKRSVFLPHPSNNA